MKIEKVYTNIFTVNVNNHITIILIIILKIIVIRNKYAFKKKSGSVPIGESGKSDPYTYNIIRCNINILAFKDMFSS